MAAIAVIQAAFKYKTQEDFTRAMTPFVSDRGFFIHTRTTKPVGSEIQFEFWLEDTDLCYSGLGIVKEEVPCRSSFDMRKAGMLITLTKVNQAFSDVLDAILDANNSLFKGSSESGKADNHSDNHSNVGPQKIVETRGGGMDDFFGDFDFDSGLDSLFSSIEKAPSQETSTAVSGLHARPVIDIALSINPDAEHIDFAYLVLDTLDAYVDTPTPQPAVYVPSQFTGDGQSESSDFETPIPQDILAAGSASNAMDDEMNSMDDMKAALDAPYMPIEEEHFDSTIEMSPTASMFRHDDFSRDISVDVDQNGITAIPNIDDAADNARPTEAVTGENPALDENAIAEYDMAMAAQETAAEEAIDEVAEVIEESAEDAMNLVADAVEAANESENGEPENAEMISDDVIAEAAAEEAVVDEAAASENIAASEEAAEELENTEMISDDVIAEAAAADAVEEATEDAVVDVAEELENTEMISDDVIAEAAVADVAEDAAEAVADVAEDAAEAVADVAEDAAEAVADVAEDAAEAVADVAENAVEAVADVAENAVEAVAEAAPVSAGISIPPTRSSIPEPPKAFNPVASIAAFTSSKGVPPIAPPPIRPAGIPSIPPTAPAAASQASASDANRSAESMETKKELDALLSKPTNPANPINSPVIQPIQSFAKRSEPAPIDAFVKPDASAEDITTQSVKKAAPRKRTVQEAQPEIPEQKKGGFFSNLFGK